MSIEFNHTILAALDARASGEFLAEMLGLPAPRRWGPFWMVTTENGVNLDYMNVDRPFVSQHYAFLATDSEFDRLLNRLQQKSIQYWADPSRSQPGLNSHDGGRGVYFDDLNGHLLEVITRPYGSGGWNPIDPSIG